MQLHDAMLQEQLDVRELVAAFASVAVMAMVNDGMPKVHALRLMADTIEVAYSTIQLN